MKEIMKKFIVSTELQMEEFSVAHLIDVGERENTTVTVEHRLAPDAGTRACLEGSGFESKSPAPRRG